VPKRGFTNIFKKQLVTVNVCDLDRFDDGAVVTPEVLLEQGVLRKLGDGVKVLGHGELKTKLVVHAQHFSATAKNKIEAAGGRVEVLKA
jgi:large subunit ribosomal protein L15